MEIVSALIFAGLLVGGMIGGFFSAFLLVLANDMRRADRALTAGVAVAFVYAVVLSIWWVA